MRVGTITLREATTSDVPTLLALVHAAFEQYRDRLDPPSGAHHETAATLQAALQAGGAVLACGPASPSAACSIIASEITCTSVASPFCRRSDDAAWAKR